MKTFKTLSIIFLVCFALFMGHRLITSIDISAIIANAKDLLGWLAILAIMVLGTIIMVKSVSKGN